jgi:uncharacterized membrane protein YfcA
MIWLTIGSAAFFASILTFFSGFGLGTLLTPVFAIWFPIEMAVGMTALIHLLNNLFKWLLIGKHTDWKVTFRFGLPAIGAAALGAWLLSRVSFQAPIYDYWLGGRVFYVLPVKVLMALLMVFFTVFELIPSLKNWSVDRKYLPWGGLLSGFFGGLSGHQGALRSAFLLRAGLSKEAFIATGITIACLIDLVRLPIYLHLYSSFGFFQNSLLLLFTTASAFAGAYWGSRRLAKATLNSVQRIVSVCLVLLALALGAGLI